MTVAGSRTINERVRKSEAGGPLFELRGAKASLRHMLSYVAVAAPSVIDTHGGWSYITLKAI